MLLSICSNASVICSIKCILLTYLHAPLINSIFCCLPQSSNSSLPLGQSCTPLHLSASGRHTPVSHLKNVSSRQSDGYENTRTGECLPLLSNRMRDRFVPTKFSRNRNQTNLSIRVPNVVHSSSKTTVLTLLHPHPLSSWSGGLTPLKFLHPLKF